MRFTVDASVHLNALNPHEEGSETSRAFLDRLHHPSTKKKGPPLQILSPTLLLTEVAASAARVLDDTETGLALAEAIRDLPGQTWVTLDRGLAYEAAELGARRRLRGADAVYCAVARRSGAVLVTHDRQQLERLPEEVVVCRPGEALVSISVAEGDGDNAEGDTVGGEPESSP